MLSFYLSALESAADKEDFRALYRRYHGVMERTALAILQDPRDAEEAVQEAFIRVIENFSKIYEIPCKNLGAWLVTIVRNEAITMLRRRRDHLPLDEDWAGFERQARDAPDYASLVALFARLPETYRAALEMKLLLGYSGAEIARWVAEQTGNVLDFQFRGDSPAQPIPQYQITALPEGYVETERTDSFGAGNVTYKNSDGDMILLDYAYMQDGASSRFVLNDTDTMSDIRVSGMPGKLILSTEEKNFDCILWIDAAQNLQFTISAAAEESVIIAMAESVSLYDPTK